MAKLMEKVSILSGGLLTILTSTMLLAGCSNNPYAAKEAQSNTLYRYMVEDPKSLDPSFSYTVDEALVTDLIYPSFYKYHYLKRDPFQIVLNLGAKEPVRTHLPGGGEEWKFTIRPNLRFQDDPCFPQGKGRAITAKDIIYSFKRMVDPKVSCPVAPFFADKVIGWKEYEDGF